MNTAGTRPRILWLNVIFLTLTPLAALVVTPVYIWHHGVQAAELIALFVLWFLVGQGITAGYHRLFSHRGYDAATPLRLYFAVVGAAAWQNSIISWASDHRIHHKEVDTDDDPYNAKRGFWYSHIGWILLGGRRDKNYPNVPDLWNDPVCRWQHRHYWLISTGINLAVPICLGLWTGRLGGMLVFALLVRVVLVHHFTFTINSLAHMWGTRPWSTTNTARDNWFLSLLSFGEGYHNYHHAYQYDYRNGPFWYNYDPSKWLIWSLSHTSLVSRLRRAPDEILLRRRYDYAKVRFAARLARRGELSLDEWKTFFKEGRDVLAHRTGAIQEAFRDGTATLSQRAELLRIRLRQRMMEAESRLETALEDLRVRKRDWVAKRQQSRRLPKRALSEIARQELQEMKRSLRHARRRARHARRRARHAFRDLDRLLATHQPV